MSMQSITTWTFSPNEPLALAKRFADLEGTALLYSGGKHDAALSSYLCLLPEKKIVVAPHERCWEELQEALELIPADALSIPAWVGYLGYEMGCFADPDKTLPYLPAETPGCLFYSPSAVVHFDHLTRQATLYAKERDFSLERTPPSFEKPIIHLSRATDTVESYQKKIAQAKEWILEGEIYQVNLSQEFHFKIQGEADAFEYFEKAVLLNPAPFTAFLNCGDFAIVSSSPERFLSKQRGRLETRPIKGTAPRSPLLKEDLKNRENLLSSAKERAELLMITDLMRSDLGKISLPGSVKTQEIYRCEAYENVFHLLSIIEGEAESGNHPIRTIRKVFPGGSVTGCPKLRAMEAIHALEKRPRGIYTGSIGYLAANGDFDFNIAIRTLLVFREKMHLQLGGGIILDSDPIKEFEETLHKGRSLLSSLGKDVYSLL